MTDILTRLEWATTGADVKAEAIEEIKRLQGVSEVLSQALDEAHNARRAAVSRAEAAEARAAAMKERCARVAESGEGWIKGYNMNWIPVASAAIATAIRNLPDTDGDGT